MHNTIEELETSNEEFQSTNEELQTSKEELQSLNEELETVNTELRRKMEDLNHVNSDLQNLLNSTQIATLFLDAELRILSFTPATRALLRLTPSDVGRPIADFAQRFGGADLVSEAQTVLSTFTTQERYLHMKDDDTRYLMRLLPYRTVENVIDGVVIAFVDVTDLKRAEEAALTAQVYAESIIQTVHEPLLVLTADLRVRSANRSFYETFHTLPTDTEGCLLYELGDGQWNIPELHRMLREVLPRNRNFEDVEVTHDFPTIGHKIMRFNIRQVQNQPDQEALILLAIEDITERKRTEEALRKSEEKRYHTLFDSIDEGFCIIEKVEGEAGELLDFRYVEANRGFAAHTGVSDVVGKTIGQAFPGEAEEWINTYDAVLRTGEPIKFERRLVTQGRILDLHAFLVGDETQSRVAVIFNDITARKQAEEVRLRLAAIVESSDDAIISKSLDGVVTSWNIAAERIFGYRAEEMIGQSILRLLPEERQDEEFSILERLRRGEHMDHFETVRKTKDGRLLDMSITISPLRDIHGTIIGASKIARDITKQKQMERKLEEQTVALQRSNDELLQFARIVSHDLNEPLRTMSSFITLLVRRYQGKLDTEADEYMGFVTDGAKRMQEMIRDLLAYTRVGGPTEAFTSVDSEALLTRVLSDLQRVINNVKAEITHDPLPIVTGDAIRLGHVLQNLISNALKFRGPAPPRIHVSAQRDGDHWRFAVRDNGIGIDPTQAGGLFQVFRRLHTRNEYEGTGIGLAICKKIVEQHGGRIWVESQPGEGSIFCFTIKI